MRYLAFGLSGVWLLLGVMSLLTYWTSRSAKVFFLVLASSTAVTLFYFAYQARWS